MNNFKIDLHTHSIISHDGSISKKQYAKLLDKGIIDFIAITDHNETSFARKLNAELGEKIIIGEEVTTKDGEIIGLFLSKTIPPGLSAKETAYQIHQQGGLVYIPHPFETFRFGIKKTDLEDLLKEVDIIEVFNARGFLRGKSLEAHEFATKHSISAAASSDAHCLSGVGSSYSVISKTPSKNTLKTLLKEGSRQEEYAKWYSYFCPKFNRIKNKLVL